MFSFSFTHFLCIFLFISFCTISNLSFPFLLHPFPFCIPFPFPRIISNLSFPFLLYTFPFCIHFPLHILFFSLTISKVFYTIFWFPSENQRLLTHDGSHFHVYVSVYQIERQLSVIGVNTQQKSIVPHE